MDDIFNEAIAYQHRMINWTSRFHGLVDFVGFTLQMTCRSDVVCFHCDDQKIIFSTLTHGWTQYVMLLNSAIATNRPDSTMMAIWEPTSIQCLYDSTMLHKDASICKSLLRDQKTSMAIRYIGAT